MLHKNIRPELMSTAVHLDVFKVLESHFGFSVALFDLSSPAEGVVGIRLTSRGTGHAVNLKQQRKSHFIFIPSLMQFTNYKTIMHFYSGKLSVKTQSYSRQLLKQRISFGIGKIFVILVGNFLKRSKRYIMIFMRKITSKS